MIWVLLKSESPWQRNNAITFFYLFFSFTVTGVFLRNRLRQYVPTTIASNSRLPIVFPPPPQGGGKTIEMWWQLWWWWWWRKNNRNVVAVVVVWWWRKNNRNVVVVVVLLFMKLC